MTYFIYAIVIIAAIRAVSFGVYTIKRGNISGAVATFLLAVLSGVAGFALFY